MRHSRSALFLVRAGELPPAGRTPKPVQGAANEASKSRKNNRPRNGSNSRR